MSGLVGAIGKIFAPVVSGLPSLGSAVTGVGATVATAGSTGSFLSGLASGAGAGVGAATSSLGTGALANILNGAAKVVTSGIGGLGSLGMTAAKGMAPAVDAAATAATGAGGTSQFFKDLLDNEGFIGAIGGLGEGYMKERELDAAAERQQAEFDYLRDKEQRLQDSYSIGAGALPDGASTGVVKDTGRPTPTEAWYWQWDPGQAKMVRTPG